MRKDKNPYRILVIEDNPGDFMIVEDFLTEQIDNPEIKQVTSYKDAISVLGAENGFFDVILLDLSLPDKSGQQLVTEIQKLAGRSPIIILTGYTDIDFSIKSISRNISDYLLKDELTATILYKSILYAIERKKYIDEIKKSEKRYSDLFRLSPQPMWLYDPETLRFLQVNKAAIDHYGYSEAEFLDMTILDIRLPDNTEKQEAIAATEINPEKTYDGRFKHIKKNGEIIIVEIYSTPLVIGNKEFRSIICIDITDKIQFEENLVKAILNTQEKERYEIGSELHDNVCQILASSQICLDKLVDVIPAPKKKWFDNSKEYLLLALEEIRKLSHRLAPAFFADSTVEAAFRKLIKTFTDGDKYEITLQFDENIARYPLSIELQLNLYRILQEQLGNILKYAKATQIEIVVLIVDDQLIMTIKDNGIGFNNSQIKEGIGLANMKRRTEYFSGNFYINSSPGKGCSIRVEIPLQKGE